MFLKQSTAVNIKIGPFVDATDGVTPETLLTISQADVRLSKNGAAFAQKTEATSCTHDENGWYLCPVDATDTGTLGRVQVSVQESGARPVWHEFTVLAANVYDALVGGGDYLQVDAVQWAGAATASDDVALATAPTNFAALAVTALGKVTVGTNDDKTGYGLSDGAITAAKFGANAVDANALAADAVDEIAADILVTPANKLTTDTSGRVSLGSILGTALTETLAGYLAAGFKKLFDVATPVFTAASVNQTGDAFGRLGAPAGASVSADIAAVKGQTAAIETDTQDLQTQVGTAGVGLTNLGDARIANLDATVSSRGTSANQTTILNRLGAWTGTGINTILGALRFICNSNLGDAPTDITSGAGDYSPPTDSLAGATATRLTQGTNISTLLNRVGAFTGTGVNTVLGFLKAALSKAATLPSDIGGTFAPAADSQEAISEAVAGLSTSAIADAVWDEAQADHVAAGSTGAALRLARAQAGGKWVVATDQLKLYDTDGVTLLVTFNLTPGGGPYTTRTPA